MNKSNHGGARKGSGRPLKHGEPTFMVTSVRIPLSLVNLFDKGKSRSETIITALKQYFSHD